MHDEVRYSKIGYDVIKQEALALEQLASRIDDSFAKACQILLGCKGHIIVMGIGKSGHIAKKIASTFLETGSPAFYIHSAEAKHGDSGMITQRDIVIMLSKSGETEEILSIIPVIKRLKIPLISFTGNPHSKLAIAGTVNLDVSINNEACPLGLAPTASTTVALVMGNALALTISYQRKQNLMKSEPITDLIFNEA